MSEFEEFVRAVERKTGASARRWGPHTYSLVCPIHRDPPARMTLSAETNAHPRVSCSEGCTYAELCEAIGLDPDAVDATPTTAAEDTNAPSGEDGKTNGSQEQKKPSLADRIVVLTTDVEFFHTPDKEPFARFEVNGHRETWSVKSKTFERWLARRTYEHLGRAPGKQAMADALTVIGGRALYEGATCPVHIRVGGHQVAIYLDLGNEKWQAVKITAAGWEVVDDPPIRFRRTNAMMPLPLPERNGAFDELRRFVNVTDDGWILLGSFLLTALRPTG